tara:strand:+ start:71 stop:496 length:426 start_codon:yes stop_codon:yes gene_type:complete
MNTLQKLHSSTNNFDTSNYFITYSSNYINESGKEEKYPLDKDSNTKTRSRIQESQQPTDQEIENAMFIGIHNNWQHTFDGWTLVKHVIIEHIPHPKHRAIFKINNDHPNATPLWQPQENAKLWNIKPPVKSLFGRKIATIS